MKFAMLVYTKPGAYEALEEEEQGRASAEYMAIRQDPRCLEGAQLMGVETATTVRVNNGETMITDGPFANTKEVFGGYYVFEADNVDAVLDLAARCPTAHLGGSVEVRPVVEPPA